MLNIRKRGGNHSTGKGFLIGVMNAGHEFVILLSVNKSPMTILALGMNKHESNYHVC